MYKKNYRCTKYKHQWFPVAFGKILNSNLSSNVGSLSKYSLKSIHRLC